MSIVFYGDLYISPIATEQAGTDFDNKQFSTFFILKFIFFKKIIY